MKKIFLVFALCFVLCCGMVVGDEAKKAEKPAEAKPEIKEMPGFWYVYMDFTGPYTTMEKEIGNFMKIFFERGLMPMGSAASIYYNSAQEVKPEALKWGFGFQFPSKVEVKEPLKCSEFKKQKALTLLHVGPYDKLGASMERVMKVVADKKLKIGPMMTVYLNNPQQVKPEELKTLIVVPIN